MVNPPKIKNLRGTAAHIEKWQECGRKLEQEYGCKVESGLEKAILIEMLPAALMEGVMARLDVNQTFDDVKRVILNYVETRIDFGGVAPMNVGNIAYPEQWLDHQEGGALENVEVCMIKYGGKVKGKGKYSFQGECNYCGEWGHKAAQCPKRLTCWTCGELGHRSAECPKGRGKGKNAGKGQPEQPYTNKRYHDQGVLTRAGARRMERGLARTFSAKERANTAKGLIYTVMEEEDWNQWSGDVEQEGDGALELFNLTDGLAGRLSNTFIPSGQPMRVNLGDFIKPKKVFTSKSSDKKDNSKNFQQNRFEILGCLLEDVKVSEEEQQDVGELRNSPDTMLSPTPSLRTNMRDSKLHSWNFGHKSTASEDCKGVTGKGMMRKVAECNSKSFESDIDEIQREGAVRVLRGG